ncbi:hypothetical protein Tco_0952586 [Tanacetum coccineum]|uniref:Uncharacterized protein n=1 Tax=Tanacetum coccineum TaxID=301880 RepID=A0ABQ5DXG3_9ASTR
MPRIHIPLRPILGVLQIGIKSQDTIMSDSEHSAVTYTSASEDDLYMGSPGVEVPVFEGPPSPDYVPGPEEPEQAPPSPRHTYKHIFDPYLYLSKRHIPTITTVRLVAICLLHKIVNTLSNKTYAIKVQQSIGFEGVENFGRHHVPPLLSTEYPDCWSLPLISLTTIAISLPNIQNDIVDSLLRSVSEGLLYVTLVEESLNATQEYVSIQKAAKMLWLEVEVHHKWLGYKLKDYAPQRNTAGHILEWYRDTAKNMVTELESMDIEASDKNSVCKSLCANSMYRITQTILIYYQDTNDEVSQEELFTQLSSMISGILAACLTNLPQVIAMKCHTSSIENREASVYAAAQLLGETTQIINNLQDRELPSLNPDELPFINKWCAYFRDQFP